VYDRTLKAVLRHPRLTLAVSVALLVLTGWMFKVMPTGFLPSDDLSQIFVVTEGAQGASFASMREHQQALAKIVGEDPNVEAYMSSIGAGAAGPPPPATRAASSRASSRARSASSPRTR
jgi:HAE1 family hydrophobic/amphiphilic exporter-1